MKDHLMGYAPAASRRYQELPYTYRYLLDWPLGTPRRVEEEWERQAMHGVRVPVGEVLIVNGIDEMTQQDREVLAANGVPLAVWTEPECYKRYVPPPQLAEKVRQVINERAAQIAQNVSKHNAALGQGAISGGYPCDAKIAAADQHAKQQEMRQQYHREEVERVPVRQQGDYGDVPLSAERINEIARCVR